jgi:hypothetical protein
MYMSVNTHENGIGLIAKPFAPRVPLAVLALAGALGDVVFFILQFVGIESFNFDSSIARQGGCFPYSNDYPISHSMAGMAISGLCSTLSGLKTDILTGLYGFQVLSWLFCTRQWRGSPLL